MAVSFGADAGITASAEGTAVGALQGDAQAVFPVSSGSLKEPAEGSRESNER